MKELMYIIGMRELDIQCFSEPQWVKGHAPISVLPGVTGLLDLVSLKAQGGALILLA